MKKGLFTKKLPTSLIIIAIAACAFAAAFLVLPQVFSSPYVNPSPNDAQDIKGFLSGLETEQSEVVAEVEPEVVEHVATPAATKGIYMSACAASSKTFRERLSSLLATTELNSIVIDIKDFSGRLSYKPNDPSLKEYVSPGCYHVGMREFIKELHEDGVYVIGRLTTFQDPYYTKLYPETGVKRADNGNLWPDKNGITYIDPGSKKAWEHVVAIAKDAYSIGFDEVNFDYIRFPSDGKMSNAVFPLSGDRNKADVMAEFYAYLDETLSPTGMKISADLFGLTTTADNDLGIGQVLDAALAHFDFVYPMVYPSHYPANFNGWANPNAEPYDLIKFVMETAVERAKSTSTTFKSAGKEPIASTSPQRYTKDPVDPQKLRPWLQDFSLGKPAYTPDLVRAQIEGTYAAGLTGWILWDAANRYSADALKKE